MKPQFTIEQLQKTACAPLNKHILQEPQPKHRKRSKYGNKKTVVGEITFDSEREANRYKELLLMLKAGLIGMLELQVPFQLNEGGTHSLKYIADFTYIDAKTGEKVIEDCKGFETKEFKKKEKLMRKIHGIVIKKV